MATRRLISAGGEMDYFYDPIRDELLSCDECVPEMLFTIGGAGSANWEIEKVPQSTGLTATDDDRELIMKACADSGELRILVTHSYNALDETARFIKRNLTENQLAHRAIILTGSALPFGVEGSSALFNLGMSVGYLNASTNGVWVSAQGDRFEADHIIKDEGTGAYRRRTPDEPMVE